jgi:hypothetical protein
MRAVISSQLSVLGPFPWQLPEESTPAPSDRMRRIEAVGRLCEWGDPTPSPEAREARREWERLINASID